MTYEELIKRLDPNVYRSLRQSIEMGKWPDGRKLSPEQRSISLEAVIHYENTHNMAEEERTGYIDRGAKAGTDCDPTVRMQKKAAKKAAKNDAVNGSLDGSLDERSDDSDGSEQYTEVKV
ncbi:MAG: YeaC family protein [Marinobacter sp.]|jgi:hypothetical protein|nr:YeaC family protein [Marinobacter sp.]MCL1481469.1 YeaC family protein [Marinobacter sp.]